MPFKVAPEEKAELLVTFAALILNDDKVKITAENITKLIEAAGAEVEPFWPKLFASLLEGRNVDELLLNAAGTPGAGGAGGAGSGSAPAASSSGGGAAAAAKKEEEKPKEKEEEEEADMGFSLFD